MDRAGQSEYRTDGTKPSRAEARRKIDRESHSHVVQESARWGGIPQDEHFDFVADLRRGRRRIYGGLLRWIDQCLDRGTPLDEALKIPALLASYIVDIYEARERERRLMKMRGIQERW